MTDELQEAMESYRMKGLAPVLLLLSMSPLFADTTSETPTAGTYLGLVTIERSVTTYGLVSRYTIQAQAQVTADGRVHILSTVPDGPSVTSLDSALTEAVLGPAGSVSVPEVAAYNYTVNAALPGLLKTRGAMFTLDYQYPSPGSPIASGSLTSAGALPPPNAINFRMSYHFVFRRTPPPVDAAAKGLCGRSENCLTGFYAPHPLSTAGRLRTSR